MELSDIISMVGTYILILLLIFTAHIFSYFMDSVLYEANKYNENRKTLKIGMDWLLWRCKKNDKQEIFTLTLVHEIISIVLFLLVTFMFILTIILKEQIIIFVTIVPTFIYVVYISVKKDILLKKTSNKHIQENIK